MIIPSNLSYCRTIICSHLGQLIHACTCNLGNSPVFVAKTIALQKGILLALQHDVHDIYTEGDNLLVIQANQGLYSTPWQIHNIIADIKYLLHNIRYFHLQHVYHKANRTADWITNLVYSTFEGHQCNSSIVNTILLSKFLGVSLVSKFPKTLKRN